MPITPKAPNLPTVDSLLKRAAATSDPNALVAIARETEQAGRAAVEPTELAETKLEDARRSHTAPPTGLYRGDSYTKYYDAAGSVYGKAMQQAKGAEETAAIAAEAVAASRHGNLHAYNGYVSATRGNKIYDAGIGGFNLAIDRSRTKEEARGASEGLRRLAERDGDLTTPWNEVSSKAHQRAKTLPSEPPSLGRRVTGYVSNVMGSL